MARCNQCGNEMPDYYTKCPNCGGDVVRGAAPAAAPSYAPMFPARTITSPVGWFGWNVLCGLLPIIGPIIMMLKTQDETAKNYAKLTLILQIIGLVLFALLAAILVPALIGYVEKASRVHSGLILTAMQILS